MVSKKAKKINPPRSILTDADWLKIRTRYQIGENVRNIAEDFNYKASNICRKAKKEGWAHGELHDVTINTVKNIKNHIDDVVNNDPSIKKLANPEQKALLKEEIIKNVTLLDITETVQLEVMQLGSEIVRQAKKVIKNNANGFYTKSESKDGKVYGRNTEIIKDLSPIINGINQRLNPNSPSVAIQNNVDGQNKESVIINIRGV